MNLPKSISLPLVVVAVLVNNLAWLYLTRGLSPRAVHTEVVVRPTHPLSNQHNLDVTKQEGAPGPLHAQLRSAASAKKDEGNMSPASPRGSSNQDPGIPAALSEEFAFQRQMDLDRFFQGDTAKKLQTIETLAPQGEALGLLRQILRVEADDKIRVAALNRLKQDHGYVATTLLLDALNDPAADVSVAAVQALATSGDRTLLPLLNEKLASLPSGPVRDQYAQAIRRLDYSVTMAMDGIAAP